MNLLEVGNVEGGRMGYRCGTIGLNSCSSLIVVVLWIPWWKMYGNYKLSVLVLAVVYIYCVRKMNKFLRGNFIVVDMYSTTKMRIWWFKLMLEWLRADLKPMWSWRRFFNCENNVVNMCVVVMVYVMKMKVLDDSSWSWNRLWTIVKVSILVT